MKQLITALVLSLSITASVTANPIITGEKPANCTTDKFDGGKDELVISADLKTGNASLSFKADKAGKGMVMVFDEAGNVVLKQPVKLTAGKNKINISNLAGLKDATTLFA